MKLRAYASVVTLTAFTLVAGASPAAAIDLADYLADAASAEYSGRRITITLFDGESQAGIYAVTHVSEMTVIGTGDSDSLVEPGKVSGGVAGAVMVSEWSRYVANDRYTTGEPVPTVRLGRAAEMVEVFENGRVRARFTFDSLTRVPLATEIYDADGKLFRYSVMLEFNVRPDLTYADMEAMGDTYDVMFPTDTTSLPVSAAGYTRADTYTGPDGTVQAFFADGLFSFSLFEIDADARLDRFDDAQVLEVNGNSYRRIVTPTELWISWETGDVACVLVGDLPPDHVSSVLAALPAPKQHSLLTRVWRGIFG